MILVTGATGNIGTPLVRELVRRGARVRAVARSPRPAEVELVCADLGAPASLAPAFAGAERLFLLTQGIDTEHARNALAAAEAANVRHVVLVSSFSAGISPRPAMAAWHHAREELVRASSIPWTILRPCGFMSNALEWTATVRQGYVLDPLGPGRQAPIDPIDIGAISARILTEPGHEGRVYTLTGDEALTMAEQIEILARAIGRPLERREALTPEDAVRARFPGGAPPALAKALVESLELMRADTAGFRTPDAARLLGRPPARFAAWCARNAAAFGA